MKKQNHKKLWLLLIMLVFALPVGAVDYYNYVYNSTAWVPWLATSDGRPYMSIDLLNITAGSVVVANDVNASGYIYEQGARVCTASNGLCGAGGGGGGSFDLWRGDSETNSPFDVENNTLVQFLGGTSITTSHSGTDITIDVTDDSIDGAELADDITLDNNLTIDSTTFVIDTTNGRVGVGTNSPAELLSVLKSQDTPTRILLSNTNAGESANAQIQLTTDGGSSYIYRTSNAYTPGSSTIQDDLVIQDNGGGDIVFFASGEVGRFKNDGKMGLGTTDPEGRLHVVGNDYLLTLESTNTSAGNGKNAGMQFQMADAAGIGYIDFSTGWNGSTPDYTTRFLSYGSSATAANNYSLVIYTNGAQRMRITGNDGFVGIGDTSPVAHLVVGSDAGATNADGAGDVYIQNDLEVDGNIYGSGADLAEMISSKEKGLEPGDVVEIDPLFAEHVRKSRTPYSTLVAGIYSTDPAIILENEGNIPLAISGRVPVKVNLENGPISAGDLLTTSSTPGEAMRCDEKIKCLGAILGKALESNESGGTITALVMLA